MLTVCLFSLEHHGMSYYVLVSLYCKNFCKEECPWKWDYVVCNEWLIIIIQGAQTVSKLFHPSCTGCPEINVQCFIERPFMRPIFFFYSVNKGPQMIWIWVHCILQCAGPSSSKYYCVYLYTNPFNRCSTP